MDIKAIETVYNGYKFRSRLEARWAVFFTEAGISYQYELEGFELAGGVRYLPDFFLPDIGVFVEVKPHRDITRPELRKIIQFAVDGDQRLLLILGTPSNEEMYLIDRRTSDGWSSFEPIEEFDTHQSQLESLFESLSDYGHVEFGQIPFRPEIALVYKALNPYLEHHLHGALLKAKQARFEHGKNG
jgi:hypothetical protein